MLVTTFSYLVQVTTFDVLHDAPFPSLLIEQVKSALAPDGTWLLADIAGKVPHTAQYPLLTVRHILCCTPQTMQAAGCTALQ